MFNSDSFCFLLNFESSRNGSKVRRGPFPFILWYRIVDFRCRVELPHLGVARGIKGKGPRLTFEPLRLLSEFRRKQKMSELNIYTTRTLETHIYIYYS